MEKEEMLKAFAQLARECRMTFREIADELDVTIGAVQKLVIAAEELESSDERYRIMLARARSVLGINGV